MTKIILKGVAFYALLIINILVLITLESHPILLGIFILLIFIDTIFASSFTLEEFKKCSGYTIIAKYDEKEIEI